jgi:hypothetical protein
MQQSEVITAKQCSTGRRIENISGRLSYSNSTEQRLKHPETNSKVISGFN